MRFLLILHFLLVTVNGSSFTLKGVRRSLSQNVGRLWRKNNPTTPVTDFQEVIYVANITIGTPPQTFQVVLDTGSSDLWVTGDSCTDREDTCYLKQKFNSSASQTYENLYFSFHVAYGTGSAELHLGSDTVCLGSNEVCIKNQPLGLASSVAPVFKDDYIQGILGLGFEELSQSESTTPFENAIKQHLVDHPYFTVYLEHHRGDLVVENAGYFTWGELDLEHCEEPEHWIPVIPGWWQFEMESIGVDSADEYPHKSKVITDTGCTALIGPREIVDQIINKYGGREVNNTIVVDCDDAEHFESLKLKIDGHVFEIDPVNFVLKSEEKCELLLRSRSEERWNLGDPFARQFCHVHDFEKKAIGLSRSKQNPTV